MPGSRARHQRGKREAGSKNYVIRNFNKYACIVHDSMTGTRSHAKLRYLPLVYPEHYEQYARSDVA
eukprot:COSAG02_NODE_5757_length_4062_cov_12.533687_1_plen_66_part_00